jgi:hypothetical protein
MIGIFSHGWNTDKTPIEKLFFVFNPCSIRDSFSDSPSARTSASPRLRG